jgi:YD repeat-containing protein
MPFTCAAREGEKDAAAKTKTHANTPSVAHFDSLGRTFLTILDNGDGARFLSRVELDIEGSQRAVRDAIMQAGDSQGRIVMRYDYDMLCNRIHQESMEAGQRWMLTDVTGKSIRSWDSRGHNFRTEYDALRRPTASFVLGTETDHSDPRTLAGEILHERMVYGERQPNDEALNLRTRVFQHYDMAGVVTNKGLNTSTNQEQAFDFKGNLLFDSRGLVADYKDLPNWSTPPEITESFTSGTQYDALNRPITLTTPDGSVVRPVYNEANLLENVDVNLRGAAAATPFVTNIDYNAKGQRVLIEYGNNTRTTYSYDPNTFRLQNLITTRLGAPDNSRSSRISLIPMIPQGTSLTFRTTRISRIRSFSATVASSPARIMCMTRFTGSFKPQAGSSWAWEEVRFCRPGPRPTMMCHA